MSKVRAAKNTLAQDLAAAGVRATIGIGIVGGVPAVKVNVQTDAARAKLPATVDGVPVQVEVVGKVRKQERGQA